MNLKLVVEYRPLKALTPYIRKLRKHDHTVERMAALMREYGLKIPILIRSSGEIVDGHLRVKAAELLGMTEVPVILCDEWTETQVRAFRLAVNRSASWADWDMELVAIEIGELKALDFDLSLTGFDSREIDELLAGEGSASAEGAPEPAREAVSRLGDLWLCADHRVICGDATSEETVHALVRGAVVALMVTDPPYGVSVDPSWRERAGLGTQRQTGTVPNDDRVDWTAAYRLFAGDVAYVWHAGIYAAEVARGLEAAGFVIRAQIIWAKQHFVINRGDFHWQHEPCWYAVRQGRSSHWTGDRTQSTLWQVPNLNPFGGDKNEETNWHGTPKPTELMRRAIVNNSQRGEIVYDPFLGSGTTLIAAEMNGRICYGMDIDPCYVDLSIRRWQKLTGKSAVLEGTDRSFEEMESERQAVKTEDEDAET